MAASITCCSAPSSSSSASCHDLALRRLRPLPPPAHASFCPSTAHRPLDSSPPSPDATTPLPPPPRLAFVYGTLKKGFGNHWLMEELMERRHARFVGGARTSRPFPLVCGPFQVPFLLHTPSPTGHHVRGEIYQIDEYALFRLDELEGTSKGHYERRPIKVVLEDLYDGKGSDVRDALIDLVHNVHGLSTPIELNAEAYFACQSYGHKMASRAPHIPCYTEKEASTYVRRKDRPPHRTFLEHVHDWIDETTLVYA